MSQVSVEKNQKVPDNDLLQVRNLTVGFRTRKKVIRALHDVSFNVHSSEMLSIVGESGSGKTTLARCIVGLAPPTSGFVMYNEAKVSELKGRALFEYRRDVQMIFQDPFESLNPRLDVFTLISTPIRYLLKERNDSNLRRSVEDLLKEVGLEPDEMLYRFPHELSGGQRQRVSIARALASNPKLLLADEPITMLDSAQRLNILALLKELKIKRSLTVIMITHDLASAKLLSDRIIVMYKGNLVESGQTQDVINSPVHPYTEMIFASMPDPLAPTKKEERNPTFATSDQSDSLIIPEKGCVFRPRCRYSTNICAEEEPLLLDKSKNHFGRCHNALGTMSN